MTAVTPLLYQAVANEQRDPDRFPRLHPPAVAALRDQLGGQVGEIDRLLERRPGIRSYLNPVPFATAVESGSIGVPMLDRSQFDDLVAGAVTRQAGSPGRHRWWEFWNTTREWLALFPGDARPQPRVTVTLPIVTGAGTQLRLLDLGLAVDRDDDPVLDYPFTPPEPCALQTEIQQPGRSYKGACRPNGCVGACEEDLWQIPDGGRVELEGCLCPGEQHPDTAWASQLPAPLFDPIRKGRR